MRAGGEEEMEAYAGAPPNVKLYAGCSLGGLYNSCQPDVEALDADTNVGPAGWAAETILAAAWRSGAGQ